MKKTLQERLVEALTPMGKRVDSVSLRLILGIDWHQFEQMLVEANEDQIIDRVPIALGVKKNKARFYYFLRAQQHHPERWRDDALVSVLNCMDRAVRSRPVDSHVE